MRLFNSCLIFLRQFVIRVCVKQLLRTVNMGRSWCHIIGRTPAVQNTYVVSLDIFVVYLSLCTCACEWVLFFYCLFSECDPDQCVLDIPVCREDQTLIATRAEGSCCLAHICSKSLPLMLKSPFDFLSSMEQKVINCTQYIFTFHSFRSLPA